MREFIQVFEHSTGRMYQQLFAAAEQPEENEDVLQATKLFDLAYVLSTYALVSGWIDGKQENNSVTTSVNLATGEVSREGTLTEMQIPRKYQKATKRL